MTESKPVLEEGHSSRNMGKMIHTRCVQLECRKVWQAISQFGKKSANGETPLVLVPKGRAWYKSSFLGGISVPAGVYCLVQTWGRDSHMLVTEDGQKKPASPGLICWSPPQVRIAYIVTKQSCTYDAPVQQCPTGDNVMVGVDVTLVFHIQDPYAFVYKLGAKKFDELLSGAVEEGIRLLVRGKMHLDIYTLRGSQATGMISQLDEKFQLVGVKFQDCKITGVWLPPDLAHTLESTTKIKSRLQTEKKGHDYKVMQRKQKLEIDIETVKRKNEQLLVGTVGEKRMASVEQEQRKLKGEETKNVEILKMEEDILGLMRQAETDLQRAKDNAQKIRMENINRAKHEAQKIRVAADMDHKMKVAESYGELQVNLRKADALRLQSDAERKGQKLLMAKRQHELQLQEKKILQQVAEHGKFNLIGPSGDAIIKSLLEGKIQNSSSGGHCSVM
eukprot:GEMP01052348.1.p1 GENE.GEMP01052348.1~~GEMP01052348.1.p1  ORF type:complete len:447 (+),score=91.14 GEMP01052348.1:98-1438(+)